MMHRSGSATGVPGPASATYAGSVSTDLRVRAILFDMDGTLVNSNPVVNEMWGRFADEVGIDVGPVLAHAHGVPSRDTLARFVPADHSVDAWHERIVAWEHELFGEVEAMPGAAEFVASLPRERWAVVTSAVAGAARSRIAQVGIEVPDILIGADDVELGKPDPEGFARAARELGVEPADCVVFEDTAAGLRAGAGAGATTVVVGDLESPETEGRRRLADWTGVSARVEDGWLVISGLSAR